MQLGRIACTLAVLCALTAALSISEHQAAADRKAHVLHNLRRWGSSKMVASRVHVSFAQLTAQNSSSNATATQETAATTNSSSPATNNTQQPQQPQQQPQQPQQPQTNMTEFCDDRFQGTLDTLGRQIDCKDVLDVFSGSEVTLAMFSQLCTSPCWNLFVSELKTLNDMGCLQELNAAQLSSLCQVDQCNTTLATQCVDLWVSMNCPDHAPSDECEPFLGCAIRASDRCPTTQHPNQPEGQPLPNAQPTEEPPAPTSEPEQPHVQPTGNTTQPTHTNGSVIVVTCKNDCSQHGTCVPLTAKNGSTGVCECHKGYGWQGLRIPFIPTAKDLSEDCSEFTLPLCTDQCNGHGLCVRVHGNSSSTTCQCFTGYTGDHCSEWNGCASLNFCNGHGKCARPSNQTATETCLCFDGYAGIACEEVVDHCPLSCSGHGHCQVQGHSRSCQCDTSYGGAACNFLTNVSCPAMCSGMGKCGSNHQCSCYAGASGADCAELTDVCNGCGHGFCRADGCECLEGFQGAHCEQFNPSAESVCSKLNFCSGRGVCVRSSDSMSYSCSCFEGFGGIDCSQVDANYNNQCPNHCSGHGRCKLLESPHCECNPGWEGSDCSVSKCPVGKGSKVCSEHGVCEATGNGTFVCTCDLGYLSADLHACESSMCPNDCNDQGTCRENGNCACFPGFSGLDCSVGQATKAKHNFVETGSTATVSSKREDEEEGSILDPSSCPSACNKHGECQLGKCQCKSGYTGLDCGQELPSLFEDEDDLDKLDLLEIGADVPKSSGGMAGLWD